MILLLAGLVLADPAGAELHSTHISLTTDAADAPRLLRVGETVLAQTQALLRGVVSTEPVGAIVVATSNEEPTVKLSDGVLRISVRPALDADSERILRQGVTERVLQTDVLGSQAWAVKGLALWASTARENGASQLRVGEALADFVFFNRDVGPPNGPAWIDARALPPLTRLLSATSADFSDDKSGHLFAAGAWMLVAVLEDTRLGYGSVLSHLASALRCGIPAAEAWTRAVGKNAAALEKDYREQVVRRGANVRSVPAAHATAQALAASSSTDSPQTWTTDARALLKAGDALAAQKLLEKAVAQQPGCVRCLDNLATAFFVQHRAPEAEFAEARAVALQNDAALAGRLAKYRGLRESLGQKPLDACATH